jgi:hypothetical protein
LAALDWAAHFCRDHLLHPDPAKRSNSFFFFFFFFGFVHGRADLYRSMQRCRLLRRIAGGESIRALPESSLVSVACHRVHRLLDAAVGRTVTLAKCAG